MEGAKAFWKSKTIFRKVMLIFSAVQFLAYFIIPVAEARKSLSSIRGLLGLGGVEVPESITQYGVYRLCRQVGGSDAPFYLLAAALMAGVLAVHLFGKKRLSYAGSLIMEGIAAFFQNFIYETAWQIGYETMSSGYMLLMLDFAVIAVSLLGIILEMYGQKRLAQAKSGDKRAERKGSGQAGAPGSPDGSAVKEKLSAGMETAGAVASYLAKEGGKKLKGLADSAKDMVNEAKAESGRDDAAAAGRTPGAGGQSAPSGQKVSAAGRTSGAGGQSAPSGQKVSAVGRTSGAGEQSAPSGQKVSTSGGASAQKSGSASQMPKSVIPQIGTMTGLSGTFAGAQIPINAGETLVLGRGAEQCSLVLEGSLVSRKHCSVQYDAAAGCYWVTDYSSNGTFLGNGSRIPAGKRVSLQPGSVIWIGNREISFRLG